MQGIDASPSGNPLLIVNNNTTISASVAIASTQPSVTFSPTDAIIEIYDNGKTVVKLNRDGSVEWPGEIVPDEAAAAFGEAIRSSLPLIAGLEDAAKHIIEGNIISDLMDLADKDGPLSAEDLKMAFEHHCVMKRLKNK